MKRALIVLGTIMAIVILAVSLFYFGAEHYNKLEDKKIGFDKVGYSEQQKDVLYTISGIWNDGQGEVTVIAENDTVRIFGNNLMRSKEYQVSAVDVSKQKVFFTDDFFGAGSSISAASVSKEAIGKLGEDVKIFIQNNMDGLGKRQLQFSDKKHFEVLDDGTTRSFFYVRDLTSDDIDRANRMVDELNSYINKQSDNSKTAAETSEDPPNTPVDAHKNVGVRAEDSTDIKQATPPITPSFDCTKAKSYALTTVCSNEELAQLDNALGSVYADLIGSSPSVAIPSLMAEQKSWTKERNACADEECIKTQYTNRIEVLKGLYDAKLEK